MACMQHDPAHCVHRHIARAARLIGARFDAALADAGLTAGQFTTLMTLARVGPVPIGRLAAELGMDSTTAPRVLRPLLARGMVTRGRSLDRRKRVIELTESGVERLSGALPAWERAQAEALAALEEGRWNDLRHDIAVLRHGLLRRRARSCS